ncbi:hypothetical protein [Sporomusa acidovorans]|uniref:Uncharacterized protein n=1 Tax=Sporomusa acidovorans (strain ATCC 49682 / DSM 3132 / Mol) TaxID=1123286 RepID=A0ABZ3IY79_SPOA4|nr:hypothetical protein [Sporomusa acidovorans]OZC15842.1 hypothetical protein SPACI_46620 [Sporomusa acidovorans DSM 3132]SDF29723.1 hypothetical protein SAMN04488499_104219 [Sporomusa acidovorans]
MSNQVILWGTFIVPWLSLFLMPREDIKRFIGAGLLGGFLSILVSEAGVANGWWYFRETTYPLAMMSSYTYGLFPVIPIWILKFTYGHWQLYMVVEAIANLIFSFFILPWFGSRGFLDFNASIIALILASVLALIIYGFQMWQDDIFVQSAQTNLSLPLQPAAAKPSQDDDPDK